MARKEQVPAELVEVTNTIKTEETIMARKPTTAKLESLTGVFSCKLVVSAKAQVVAARMTLQRGAEPTHLGKGWHKGCKPALNSRHTTLNTLAALGGSFTYEQAIAALSALPKATLGSGTPRSYLVAFVKEGYLEAYAA